MRFADRADAGRRWRCARSYRDPDPVVLALPRGGLPVAAEIASALAAPLDVVLVRKIGVPWQPDLAMGALVEGDAADRRAQRSGYSAAGSTSALRGGADAQRSPNSKTCGGGCRRPAARRRSPAAPRSSSTTASPPARPRAPRCSDPRAAAPKTLTLAVPVASREALAAPTPRSTISSASRRRRASARSARSTPTSARSRTKRPPRSSRDSPRPSGEAWRPAAPRGRCAITKFAASGGATASHPCGESGGARDALVPAVAASAAPR